MKNNLAIKLLAVSLAVLFLPLKAFCAGEMLIGLIPEENIFNQVKRHRPLAAYLSSKLGKKVKLSILSRYGDIIDKFESRGMDGAFFGVYTGFITMERLGVEPIARPVALDGKSTVRSYIFVRKDSGIKTVKELRGKRIAFVDSATVTGYLYAVSFFNEKGIHDVTRYFKECFFTGSHDSVVASVFDNRADVGCAMSRVYQKMIEKDVAIKNELTIIAASDEFPAATLCLRKSLPASLKAKIKGILLHMEDDPEGRAVLNKLGALRFVEAKKADFMPFAHLIRKAEAGKKPPVHGNGVKGK